MRLYCTLSTLALLACGPPSLGDRGGSNQGPSAHCLDLTGDGNCEYNLDADCMTGSHATEDSQRQEACFMMALTNADRAHFTEESGNADPVVWDERLWEVAKGHVDDLCAREYFEHESLEGLSPTDRANAMGYDFSVAENIVLGPNSANNHFRWMDEPTCTGHRGNILNPKNRRVGIAVIRCETGRWAGTLMAVQNFHMNHTFETPAYCQNDATHCEMPPAPISKASENCSNCPINGEEMMAEWGCPED